jgi:hypothetical protein
MTTPANQPISLWKAASAIIVPLVVAFCIGAFTLVWKMDKLTDQLTLRFDYTITQVKEHDLRLSEHEKRIRVLELEQFLAERTRKGGR